jgi:hemoglobin
MKTEIATKKDIQLLVDTFYDKVKIDATIGFFFTEVIQVNWEKHLPKMYEFWENIAFSTGNYKGNPIELHKAIHIQHLMTPNHFDHWLSIFLTTIDELFVGNKAAYLKERATSIATFMKIKIVYS